MKRFQKLIPFVLALLAIVAIVALAVTDEPTSGPAASPATTVQLDGPGRDTVVLGPRGQDALEQAQEHRVDDHAGLRDETPPGVPRAQLEASRRQQLNSAAANPLPNLSPLAAPTQRGCRSQFVGNFSSRGGVRPLLWVLHYTVSPNRVGWADIDGLTAFSNSRASGVSWNFNVDHEGNCAYTVRETDKAWTQGNFNPWAISVEIVNTGHDASYAGDAGLRKLAMVISDSAARWDIPIRRGTVSGCTVLRSGIVDHNQLGACGGGHHDITPWNVQTVIDAVLAFRRATSTPLTRVEQRIVRGIRAPRGTGHTRRYWCRRNARQRAEIRTLARRVDGGWNERDRDGRYQLLAAPFRTHCRR